MEAFEHLVKVYLELKVILLLRTLNSQFGEKQRKQNIQSIRNMDMKLISLEVDMIVYYLAL